MVAEQNTKEGNSTMPRIAYILQQLQDLEQGLAEESRKVYDDDESTKAEGRTAANTRVDVRAIIAEVEEYIEHLRVNFRGYDV